MTTHAVGRGSSSPGPSQRRHSSSRPATSVAASSGVGARRTTTPSVANVTTTVQRTGGFRARDLRSRRVEPDPVRVVERGYDAIFESYEQWDDDDGIRDRRLDVALALVPSRA